MAPADEDEDDSTKVSVKMEEGGEDKGSIVRKRGRKRGRDDADLGSDDDDKNQDTGSKQPPKKAPKSRTSTHKPSEATLLAIDYTAKGFLNDILGLEIPDTKFKQDGTPKAKGLGKQNKKLLDDLGPFVQAYQKFHNDNVGPNTPCTELDLLDFAIRICCPHDPYGKTCQGVDPDPLKSYRDKLFRKARQDLMQQFQPKTKGKRKKSKKATTASDDDGGTHLDIENFGEAEVIALLRKNNPPTKRADLELAMKQCIETVRRVRDTTFSIISRHPFMKRISDTLRQSVLTAASACWNDKARMRALFLHGIDSKVLQSMGFTKAEIAHHLSIPLNKEVEKTAVLDDKTLVQQAGYRMAMFQNKFIPPFGDTEEADLDQDEENSEAVVKEETENPSTASKVQTLARSSAPDSEDDLQAALRQSHHALKIRSEENVDVQVKVEQPMSSVRQPLRQSTKPYVPAEGEDAKSSPAVDPQDGEAELESAKRITPTSTVTSQYPSGNIAKPTKPKRSWPKRVWLMKEQYDAAWSSVQPHVYTRPAAEGWLAGKYVYNGIARSDVPASDHLYENFREAIEICKFWSRDTADSPATKRDREVQAAAIFLGFHSMTKQQREQGERPKFLRPYGWMNETQSIPDSREVDHSSSSSQLETFASTEQPNNLQNNEDREARQPVGFIKTQTPPCASTKIGEVGQIVPKSATDVSSTLKDDAPNYVDVASDVSKRNGEMYAASQSTLEVSTLEHSETRANKHIQSTEDPNTSGLSNGEVELSSILPPAESVHTEVIEMRHNEATRDDAMQNCGPPSEHTASVDISAMAPGVSSETIHAQSGEAERAEVLPIDDLNKVHFRDFEPTIDTPVTLNGPGEGQNDPISNDSVSTKDHDGVVCEETDDANTTVAQLTNGEPPRIDDQTVEEFAEEQKITVAEQETKLTSQAEQIEIAQAENGEQATQESRSHVLSGGLPEATELKQQIPAEILLHENGETSDSVIANIDEAPTSELRESPLQLPQVMGAFPEDEDNTTEPPGSADMQPEVATAGFVKRFWSFW